MKCYDLYIQLFYVVNDGVLTMASYNPPKKLGSINPYNQNNKVLFLVGGFNPFEKY